MAYTRYGPPTLKKTVDLQLQSAFAEGNWATAVRLADKRAKSTKDPYYEAIKICAESQLDGPAEKCAVLVAVDGLVRKGAVVKDLETIELYEWACRDLTDDLDYSETLGALRFRWVKANPKNSGVTQCLQACIQNWDLVNAQQIAAILDKSFPNTTNRRYMFWSITLTFLLSISPQCPEGKQKLYGLLALKQLDRAADLTETSDKSNLTDRGIRKEEEIYLYYRVLAVNGAKPDFVNRMLSRQVGASKQLEEGRKHLFLEALDIFEKWEKWQEIYDLCLHALTRTEDDGTPSLLASDWRVWKRFIAAASQSSDDHRAFEEVQNTLQAFVSTNAKIAQMYKKNIALAVLEIAFRLPQSLYPQSSDIAAAMPRVTQLCLFLDRNYDRASAFDDVKGYVSALSFEEANHLTTRMLPKMSEDDSKPFKRIHTQVLQLKFRYLLTTCPQTLSDLPSAIDGEMQTSPYQCRVCSNKTTTPCRFCLADIITAAASIHGSASSDSDFKNAIPTMDKDPRLDLSLIIAMSALKLAGLTGLVPVTSRGHPLHHANPSLVLKAALVLDTQLKETPEDTTVRLLLVQLYLLLGCASHAYHVWGPLDVKRTIQDALSPLFFDRIYSLSPGLFQGSRPPMEPLRSYYSSTLKENSPVRVWDAFNSGSYTSILDIAEFDSRLRRGCTLVMSVVEERRAARAFGGKLDMEVREIPLLADIQDSTELVNVTDYGSLPSLESPSAPPIQDLIRLGPGLSNERAHLSLLTEQFLDLVSWKPPKDYKPAKPAEIAAKERNYLTESLARLHNSLIDFLHAPHTPERLTGPEETYFTAVSLLAAILLAALNSSPSKPPSSNLPVLTTALKSTIASSRTAFLATPPLPIAQPEIYASFTDMHAMTTLRDTAVATRLSVSLVLGFHEKEAARDRTGRSSLHKDVVAELKALDALGAKALGDVRGRIKILREKMGEAGWLDRVLGWTFGADDVEDPIAAAVGDVVGGRAGAEEWAGKVLESWREGLKGWANVRME